MYYLCMHCQHFEDDQGFLRCKANKYSTVYFKFIHPTLLVRNCESFISTDPLHKGVNRYDFQVKKAYYWLKRKAKVMEKDEYEK